MRERREMQIESKKHDVGTKNSKRKRQNDPDIESGKPFAITEISIPASPDFSTEKLPKQRQNFSWFAYGRFLTPLAIASSIAGFSLSFLSMRSYAFVQLDDPLKFPNVHNVTTMGLLFMRICFDETEQDDQTVFAGSQAADVFDTLDNGHRRLNEFDLDESFLVENWFSDVFEHSDIESRRLMIDAEMILGGCHKIRLTLNMVDDKKWNAARSFLALAIAFGGFLMIMLSTSIYWESINLKPISIGLLLTYFFQSLSFFFFDTDMCRKRGCGLAEGSIMGIVAGVMWFLSALLTIRMDVLYRMEQRKLQKLRRRMERRLERAKAAMLRYHSTVSTAGDDSIGPLESPLDTSDTNMTPVTAKNSSDSDDENSQSTSSNYFATGPWVQL